MRRSSDRSRSERADPYFERRSIGYRVIPGRRLPWAVRRAGLVVVSSDIDAEAGVAAVWLAHRTARPRAAETVSLYELIDGTWQHLSGSGGGDGFAPTPRPSAARAGQALMLASVSGGSVRSRADRQALGDLGRFDLAGWVACAMFRAATEVTHLTVGTRLVLVPEHGYVIVAWKAPPSAVPPPRPPVAALGPDGAVLTELGPSQHIDTLSWAAIEQAISDE
jgi:hypothetical protein